MNVVPLLGVVAFGWSLFDVILVYWFENLIVGVVNLLRMGSCVFGKPTEAALPMLVMTVFLGGFFTVHYGGFCFVHGMFVGSLFGGDLIPEGSNGGPGGVFPHMFAHLMTLGPAIAVAGLLIGHLIEFYREFLVGGAYRTANPGTLMFRPYPRVIVLHIAILGGGFAIGLLGEPVIALVILVTLKTAFDIATAMGRSILVRQASAASGSGSRPDPR